MRPTLQSIVVANLNANREEIENLCAAAGVRFNAHSVASYKAVERRRLGIVPRASGANVTNRDVDAVYTLCRDLGCRRVRELVSQFERDARPRASAGAAE